jgi:hypothetical protein
MWQMGGNVIEDRTKVGERRNSIARFHRPCLAQVARTC